MPTIQKILKTVGIPQVQFKDEVVDVPFVMQRQELVIQMCRNPWRFHVSGTWAGPWNPRRDATPGSHDDATRKFPR